MNYVQKDEKEKNQEQLSYNLCNNLMQDLNSSSSEAASLASTSESRLKEAADKLAAAQVVKARDSTPGVHGTVSSSGIRVSFFFDLDCCYCRFYVVMVTAHLDRAVPLKIDRNVHGDKKDKKRNSELKGVSF